MAIIPRPDRTALGGKCALVADDDGIIRDILFSLLTGAGYTVISASSGREALSLASNLDASVAIIDLSMPDGNGLQTCAGLRRMRNWQDVPIIVLTQYSIGQALKAAMRAGADGFLRKPIVPSELLWCLETHSAKKAIAAPEFPFGPGFDPQLATDPAMPETLLPPVGSEWILGCASNTSLYQQRERLNIVPCLTPLDMNCKDALIVTYDGRPRILVGEYDPPTQAAIRRVLSTKGYEVDFAHDGHEVLSMFVTNHYDLVLMNVGITVTDGINVVHSVRALQIPKGSTPVVAMMPSVNHPLARDLKDAGINGYLMVPVTTESLLSCLLHNLPAKTSGQVPTQSAMVKQALDPDTLSRVAKFLAPDAVASLLNKLVVLIEEILPMLDEDWTDAVPAELANRLHSLAGTAGTLGCGVLSAAARDLEADHAVSDRTRQLFIETTQETLVAIHAYMALLHGSASGSQHPDPI